MSKAIVPAHRLSGARLSGSSPKTPHQPLPWRWIRRLWFRVSPNLSIPPAAPSSVFRTARRDSSSLKVVHESYFRQPDLFVALAGCGGDNDCESKRQLYYTAVETSEQCDPAAAAPCASYDGVECPTVGVNPNSVAPLSAKLSEYKAAGCTLPIHSCPVSVMTPPPYTCQAGADGVNRCYSACEQIMGGRATCVSQSIGCANGVRAEGCGPSLVCCLP